MTMTEFDLFKTPLEGISVIEAGAGSGKTFNIENLFVRLLIETGAPVSGILTVTYTNAAAAELRERVRARLIKVLGAFKNPGAEHKFPESEFLALYSGSEGRARRALEEALLSFDEAAIFTIHGFCGRTLNEAAFGGGEPFNTELAENHNEVIDRAVEDFYRARFYGAEKYDAASMLPAMKLTLEGMRKFARAVMRPGVKVLETPPADAAADPALALKTALVKYLGEAVEQAKRELRVKSFDDLLTDLSRSLDDPKKGPPLIKTLREKYQAALIDEFQDTDPVQYNIFSRIFGPGGGGSPRVFLIGDPKQAIYSFRNADIHSYFSAKKGAGELYSLLFNYRSEKELVDSVNSLIAPPGDSSYTPFALDPGLVDFSYARAAADSKGERSKLVISGSEAKTELLWIESEGTMDKTQAEAAAAKVSAAEIRRLLELSRDGKAFFEEESGRVPLRPGDIAVLVAIHKQASLLKKELEALSVPAVLQSAGNILETPEAEMTALLMRALLEPSRTSALNAALTTVFFGWDGPSLAAAGSDPAAQKRHGEAAATIKRYHELWMSRSFAFMMSDLMPREQVRERALALPGGERTVTNITHLTGLLHKIEAEEKLSPSALAARLTELMSDPEDSEEHLIRLERDDEAVQIMTVFKSKGLERRIVFNPFLWSLTVRKPNLDIPSAARNPNDPNGRVMILEPEKFPSLAAETVSDSLAEKMRLMYVALTRAVNKNYIVCCPVKNISFSPFGHRFSAACRGDGKLLENLKVCRKKTWPETEAGIIAEIKQSMADTAALSGGLTSFTVLPEPGGSGSPSAGNFLEPPGELLESRRFSGRIDSSWRITSYSSLKVRGEDQPDLADSGDEDHIPPVPGEDAGDTCSGAFLDPDFPGGKNPGTCLHGILEHVDFAEPPERFTGIIKDALETANISPEENTGRVIELVRKLSGLRLTAADGDSFTLADISPADKVAEMEFHYPFETLDFNALARAVTESPAPPCAEKFAESLGKIAANPGSRGVRGLMSGIIDLIFRRDGKYYVIDWKSDALKPGDTDLAEIMVAKGYMLQSYIYSHAAARFMEAAGRGENYTDNFGGVFYIFLRGAPERGNLVFHDTPQFRLIKILSGGKGARQ